MKLNGLLLRRKAMTNLYSVLKSRDTTLLTKVCIVKAMVFPVVMCHTYGCESWTIKKAECIEPGLATRFIHDILHVSMHDTGCLGLVHWDDPEGWNGEGGGRRVQDGEQNVYLWRIHLDIWQN